MNTRHLLMAASLCLAAALAWSGNRNNSSDPAGPAEPVVHEAARPPRVLAQHEAGGSTELPVLALLERGSAPAGGPQGQDGQHARRLFGAHSWAPRAAPVAPVIAPMAQAAAPALPFSYIGRKTQGGQVEVFLSQGDTVHVVRVASLIESTYRVDAISPTAVSFTFLPLNTTQQLSIGASD